MNCFDCRFAREARETFHNGEQVRCAKAEELFGGVRWVNVLPESKCGKLEPFKGDDSRAPDVEDSEKRKAFKRCDKCKGSGKMTVQFLEGATQAKCYKCKGRGNMPIDS